MNITAWNVSEWSINHITFCNQGPFDSPQTLLRAYSRGQLQLCNATFAAGHWDTPQMLGAAKVMSHRQSNMAGWNIPELNGGFRTISYKWSIFQQAMFDYQMVFLHVFAVQCRSIELISQQLPVLLTRLVVKILWIAPHRGEYSGRSTSKVMLLVSY